MKIVQNRYIIILLLSLLPFLHIFSTPDLPHTSDGQVQIPRMAAFYKAVSDAHIPVRWAGDLNYGYGMPLFNFIYHMPFYLSSFFIFIGLPLVLTFKLVLAISFLLSGVSMLVFAKSFFQNETKAFLVTVLYQFAPYRLIEILVRGSIGGIYAYAFFPIVLWGITEINKSEDAPMINLINFNKLLIPALSIVFGLALMILSHNSLALLFFLITLLFVLFFSPSIKKKIACLILLGLGVGVCSFYWLPALVEHKYTYGDLFMKDIFLVNFPRIELFFIPNPFDIQALRVSEIALHWGLMQTVVLVYTIFLLIKKSPLLKKAKKIILFSFILILFSTFFMQPISIPIWKNISFLRQFQFPWRFLAMICFSTAFLGAVFFEAIKKIGSKLFISIIFLTVFSTMYYWKPTQGYDKVASEKQFWDYPLNTTYFGETDVIWSAGPADSFPTKRIEVIEGEAATEKFNKTNHTQTFLVNAKTPARLVSHTQYFPGWRVYVDNQKTPIEFQDVNWRGLITFFVPEGKHTVLLRFEETIVRIIADIISLATLLLIFTTSIFVLFKKKLSKKFNKDDNVL